MIDLPKKRAKHLRPLTDEEKVVLEKWLHNHFMGTLLSAEALTGALQAFSDGLEIDADADDDFLQVPHSVASSYFAGFEVPSITRGVILATAYLVIRASDIPFESLVGQFYQHHPDKKEDHGHEDGDT